MKKPWQSKPEPESIGAVRNLIDVIDNLRAILPAVRSHIEHPPEVEVTDQDPVADAAKRAADVVDVARRDARDVVDHAADTAAGVLATAADLAHATLSTLQSIDAKLDRLPDYPALLDVERAERKKGARANRALIAVVAVVALAVGSLAYLANQWRIEGDHATRCLVRHEVHLVVNTADPNGVIGRRVLTAVDSGLPTNCGGTP